MRKYLPLAALLGISGCGLLPERPALRKATLIVSSAVLVAAGTQKDDDQPPTAVRDKSPKPCKPSIYCK